MSPDAHLHELLSPKLAAVVRLCQSEASDEEIAAALGTPVEAVGPLVELAEAKLSSLRRRFGDDPATSDRGSG